MTIHIVPEHSEDPDEMPLTPALIGVILDWDGAVQAAREKLTPRPCAGCGGPAVHSIAGKRWCDDCAPLSPPPAALHVTAQMIADIWSVEGPQRVATVLARLPWEDRERLCQDYWRLLRQRGHGASLVEIGIQFCVVERLAA